MAQVLQLRRGTTAQNDAFTGAIAEVSVDTDRDSLRVHDGTTMGGKEIAPLNVAIPLLADATTVNLADELVVQQGGITKRATVQELANSIPPQLPDATTVNLADELVVQQGGITKRATVQELANSIPPQLPDATTVNAADELIIQQGGITKRATRNELMTFAATGATAARLINDRFADIVSLKDFGAAGNGITDDSSAVLAALNSGAKVVDGGGLTYRINSPLAPSSQNITVQNATFDFSGVPDQPGSIDRILSFSGSMGTATNLSANASAGAFVLSVGSTSGFAADMYAWLSSSTIFESSQVVTLGQIVQIKSVDNPTQLTLYNDVLYNFTTAATANIRPLSMKRNIRFRNVNFIGANSNTQSVLDFDMCADVEVTGCSFDFCDYVACRVSRTVNFFADNCAVRRARAAGTSYGFAVGNGSYSVKIVNSYGEDLRHFVTVGDNDGVNLFVNVTNCHVSACQDAGIDAHAACDFMVIDGNTIEGSSFDSGQLDGIIFQGLNCTISNNIVVGARRHSIFYQRLAQIGTGSVVISGNQIVNGGGAATSESGINVVAQQGNSNSLKGVSISSNTISSASEYGIYVYALSGNIESVSIIGNSVTAETTLSGILVRAEASYTLSEFAICGNTTKCGAAGNNIYCLGGTTQNVINGSITGNVIFGGVNGIRMIQTQNVVETGNYNTGTTRKVFVDTGSSNIWMDRRFYAPVTATNATYTVTAENGHIICNRAGTITLTLPTASEWTGREITVKTIQAQTVVSASSDVVPIDGSVAGTAILPATDGAWALLRSDGANWVIMQRG